MQPFRVQIKESLGLVKNLEKDLLQIILIKDHLLKLLIHHQVEGQGPEIINQDLMISF